MSFLTKIRDSVENVVAAPFAVTGAPVQKLTSTSAQQSAGGAIVSGIQKSSLAIGTGVAATIVAGPAGKFIAGGSSSFKEGATMPEQLSGPGSDYTPPYIDSSPNTSTVASGGDLGEKSNGNSITSLLQGLTGSVNKLAQAGVAANAGARRVGSPLPTAGSNLNPGPSASGPVIIPQESSMPGGMLLPIAALAILAFKLL